MILFLPKIYGKRDDFDFEIVNFPFLDGDVPHSTSYGVYINPIMVGNFAFLYNCTLVGRTSDSMMVPT